MRKRFFAAAISLLMPWIGFSTPPLQPTTPAVIAGSNPAVQFTNSIVAANQAGFMVIWQDGDVNDIANDVIATFTTDNGSSWSMFQTIASDSAHYPYIAGNSSGFTAVWMGNDPGWANGLMDSAFYNIHSNTWTGETLIDGANGATSGSYVGSFPTGFIAAWVSSNDNSIYANVSSDGIIWQETSRHVLTSSSHAQMITACGNAETLLVAWLDDDVYTAYVSLSTDFGNTWSEIPISVVTGLSVGNDNCLSCFANDSGFLLAYVDSSATLWSVFSEDGISWGMPVQIATNVGSSSIYYYSASLGGNNQGFVVAWVDADYNAWGGYSSNGTTWDYTVRITHDGSVYSGGVSYFNVIDVSAYEGNCMFSWVNNDEQAVFSYSSIPYTSKSVQKKFSGFNTSITPNKPGMQLNR